MTLIPGVSFFIGWLVSRFKGKSFRYQLKLRLEEQSKEPSLALQRLKRSYAANTIAAHAIF
jgi:hypothetical protein